MSDYTNIEGLVIEVESDASSASQELEWLTARIEQFKSAVTDSRSITTFANNLDKLTLSLSNMSFFRDTMSSFASFSTGMAELSKVSIKANNATNLGKMAESIGMFSPESISQLETIVTALSGLSAINGLKISSTIPTYLEKIAEATKKMDGIDFTKLRELTEALAPLAQVAVADGEGMRNLASAVKTFSSAANTGAKRGHTFNTVLANIRVKTLAIISAFRKVVNVVLSGLETYGDYIETLNLFSVSMGESAEKAFEYANKVQDALGIDLTQWMKAQGVFQTLAKGFGIATDRATIMSQQLTQLAYDISSFYNISVADAVQKVQSAFSGELEPVRRLGFDLSQAKLQAIALSLGIDEDVKSMDQAEKASLRYYALLTQVTDAQGDLARTLQSPTNQLRIFNAQITQLSRSLGMLFIPILNNVLPYLNAIVQVLKWIIDEIAALFGYTLPGVEFKNVGSGVAEGVGEVSDALDEANGKAEELKNTLASFDEINLIGSKSGGKGGSGDAVDIGSGFDFELPQYDFLGEATENRAKKIADNIKKVIAPAVEKLKDAIILIRDNWDDIYDTAKLLVMLIGGVKLLSKLTSLKESLKSINKTALGLGLAISGITLSYTGGKDVAKGNTIKGIIEAAFGATLAGIGGYLAFGTTGLIIGLGASVIAYFAGFEIEKQAQFEQSVKDLYFSLDEGKQSLDDFVNEWNTFTQAYVDGFDKISGNSEAMNEAKSNIETISTSIQTLKNAYDTGEINVDQFATEMSELIKKLSENIQTYMYNAHQAITTELGGALGEFLIRAGYTTSEIEKIMNLTDSKIEAQITATEKNIESLQSMKAAGLIDDTTFVAEINKNVEALQKYVMNTEDASKALEDFKTANKFGINFGDLDSVLGAIDKIKENYDMAAQALDKESKTVLDGLRFYAQNADEEYRGYFENVLKYAEQYYAGQGDALKNEFISKMSEIESSSALDFEKILNTRDLEAIEVAYDTSFSKIRKAIEGVLDAEGIEWKGSKGEELFTKMTFAVEGLKKTTGDDNWAHKFAEKFAYAFGIDREEIEANQQWLYEQIGNVIQAYKEGGDDISANLLITKEDIEDNLGGIPFASYASKGLEEYIYEFKKKHPTMKAEADALYNVLKNGANISLLEEGKSVIETFTEGIDEEKTNSLLPTMGAIPGMLSSLYISETSSQLNDYTKSTAEIIFAIKDALGEGETSLPAVASDIVTSISDVLSDPEGAISASVEGMTTSALDVLDGDKAEFNSIAKGWIGEISNVLTNDTSVSKNAEDWVANIKKSMEEKSVDLKATGDAIRTTILTAANAAGIMSFDSFGGDVIDTIKTSIDNNKSSLATPASDIIKTMYDELKNDLDVIDTYGGEFTDTLIGSMTSSDKKTKFEDASVKMVGYIGDGFDSNTSTLEGYGSAIVRSIVSGINTSSSSNDLTSAVTTIKNKVEKPFETMSNDIGNTFENMLKKLAKLFNEFKITGQFNASMPNLANFKIPGFASGGYPDSGEIFIANENGIPEYIGSMGNRTAVANNQQIVDGVAQGVYKAIKNTGIANDVKTLTQKDNTVVFAPSVEAGKVMSRSSNMYKGVGGRYS